MTLKGVGLGVYTPAEAARLTGIPVSTLRSWTAGGTNREPFWRPQHFSLDEPLLLGFRDLIEAKVLNSLRERGFSSAQLRGTMAYACEQVGDERPFSTQAFKLAGKDILLDMPDDLLVVSRKGRGQSVMRQFVEPILRPVVYDDYAATRMWMQPRKRTILLDPTRAFGAPILDKSGIPTDVLAHSARIEGSAAIAAAYFVVPVEQVRDAQKFEERLAA